MFIKFFILCSVFLFTLSATNPQEMPVTVSTSWLQDNLQDKDTLIIDVRKEKLYKRGHILGAINMPVMKDFLTEKTLMLPKIDFLKNLFSEAGIDDNTKIVIYDNGQFCWAARAYWVFKVLGHNQVALLQYGYGKKLQDDFEISKKSPERKRKNFIVRINNDMIATKLDTYMAMKNKTPILDGRTEDMYMGRTSIAKRHGHIPTAKLFSGSINYTITKDGSQLKSFDDLKNVYASLPKEEHIILYCQDGADAALDYIMMNELGFRASVYDGSWLEWANDFNLPVENPSAK